MTQASLTSRLLDESVSAYQSLIAHLRHSKPRQLILVNPQLVPEEVFDPLVAKHKGYYAFPPVGLLYLAAVARAVVPELKVQVLDLNYELLRLAQEPGFRYQVWKEILEEAIRGSEAPWIGITCMFGATKPIFLEVAKWIQEHFPQIPILAGGVQATYDAREMLEGRVCDILFRREAELQFKSFLESLFHESLDVPHGIAFQFQNKVYELGAPSEDVPIDWDVRPFYDLVNVRDYYQYGSLAAFSRYNGSEKPFATVLSNRGCRARCTFCTVRNFNGFGVRQRSVQNVIDEIKFLVRQKGVRQIDWLDDDLLMDPVRTVNLFKGLATQVPELEWICNNGLIAAAITDEIMEWMVKSGLRAFKIGIESGNDEILHQIKKPTTKPKLRQKRELFLKYPQVFVSANFIIGFPREIFAQMLDTFNFASELKWDWSSFYICQPLKGTEMFSAFQDLGDERTEVEGYDKTLNPGRAASRGEFGYHFKEDGAGIKTGRDIFQIPLDLVPSQEQVKEIWFTFNLIANFIENPNFFPGGNPDKIVRWFESIVHAYPYDASMCAGLVRGYQLLNNAERAAFYRERFISILKDSVYWRKRVEEFPELADFAGVSKSQTSQERN